MIKGTQLIGRAVIDMEAAERLGRVKEIIVQRNGERVAGFIVVHGETIIGTGGTLRTIPASALHSIGPDAITVRGAGVKERSSTDLGNLPRMSDVIGRKMLTRSGRLLGSINDLLINGENGTIIGFALGEGARNKLENFLNPQRSRIRGYVRADADLHVGYELIVVPDDALIAGEPGAQKSDHKPATEKTDEIADRGWGERDSMESTGSNVWTRRTNAAAHAPSKTPGEIRIKSETARPIENIGPAAPSEAAPEAPSPVAGSDSMTGDPQDESHQS